MSSAREERHDEFPGFHGAATTGPIISEDEFYMGVLIPNVRKAVKECGIRYDPGNPVPSGDEFADRFFEAAIEFLAQTGVYCDVTNRIIHLDRAQIMKAVEDLPEGGTFGEGQDRRLFKWRGSEDKSPPWFHVGTGTVASTEEIALAQVEGYGNIHEANSISIPAFNRVKGMPVIGGSPLEIHAAINSIQVRRKALSKCGRTGLPILNLISSAPTAMGTIAGSFPTFGLRQSDGWLIDVIAEMKVYFETLNRLPFILLARGNIRSTALPILKGYAGGPEGMALVMTAYAVTGMKAEQASELVNQLLDKYEKEIEHAPQGKRYQECYDLKTGKPLEDYARLYDDLREGIVKMGIPFQT